MEIDPEGPVPVYRQLADLLRARIEAGDYPPGRALPSHRTLSQEYGLAMSTVTKALAILRAEGLTEGVKGKGTYVKRRS